MFVLLGRDGYPDVPTEQAMTVVLAARASAAVAVALVASGRDSLAVSRSATPSVLPLLVFTGIFAAAIPSLGFLIGIRLIGGTRAGILMLFEPVVGVALAAWLLAETLVPIQVVGAVGDPRCGGAAPADRARAIGRVRPTTPAPLVVPGGP